MEKDYILDIMRSNKTVFTFQDVVLLWGESDVNFIKKKNAESANILRMGILQCLAKRHSNILKNVRMSCK